jgi:hypothetical protein
LKVIRSLLIPLGLVAASAAAQEARPVPRLLLDRRLQERPVQLTAVDDKTVMFADSAGVARTEVISDYLAILSPPDRPTPRPVSILELADGQRFVGNLAEAKPSSPDSLLWTHGALGTLEFNLDQVRVVQLQGGPEVPTRKPGEDTSDLVILVNGDRIDGFVDAIGPVVTIDSGEAGGSKRDIPHDRIQIIVLGASKSPAPEPGMTAWLGDGSIIACRAVQTSRAGELILTPRNLGEMGNRGSEAPGATVALRLDDLWALEVQPRVLLPLASLPFARQEPGAGRRWTRAVESVDPRWSALGLADIELPGPLTAEWDLPAGAIRFATDAELPRQMWTWGDCEVVISAVTAAGESELWRKRLNADSSRSRIATALPQGSQRLRVRIEAGEYGAVQDKVVLRRPVISLAP